MTLFSLKNKNNVTSTTFKKFIEFDENAVETGDWGFYVETDEKTDPRKKCNVFYTHLSIMNKHNSIAEEDEFDDETIPKKCINTTVYTKPQYKKNICSALFELFCKRHYVVLPTIVYLLCMVYCILR